MSVRCNAVDGCNLLFKHNMSKSTTKSASAVKKPLTLAQMSGKQLAAEQTRLTERLEKVTARIAKAQATASQA